ncbi:uncharacterized protein LOC121733042 [Aricia agestis]|uniref:uncharacterized protein LOC121733042 n=1 Tax=Aricia agestis TaxID=91739 RepID=UPI001C20B8ED|nr:uncharacterized protein LOC121733042 [Aricia agestis]
MFPIENACVFRSQVFKSQPRWVLSLILSVSLLFIVAVAVATGILIGYAFCYLINHLGYETASQPYTPTMESNEARNRTINAAISNVLVPKIVNMAHVLWKNNTKNVPLTQ